MASLFLSYSRDDVGRIAQLAAALEVDGHKVWWDRHISGGQEYAPAIEEALESADVVIVCWTAKSIQSAWVRDEAGSGRDRGRLVPVTLDGCQPPLGFRQYQTVDLSRWNGKPQADALERLRTAINDRLGSASPIKSLPHPPRAARWRRRLPFGRWRAMAAGAALITATALLFPHVIGTATIEPKVAIGKFDSSPTCRQR